MKSVKSAKPVTPATSATVVNPESAIRVLKTGTCPALSGKSKLTYQIGCMGKSDIQFRITANSGHGFFSDDWVALSDIQEALDKIPVTKPVTSYVLNVLFRGKSMNSSGFLFAALKQEGLVERSKDKPRCYDRFDPKDFMASVKALKDLTGDAKAKPPKTEAKPASQSKLAAPTKKAASKPKAKKKA